MFKLRRIRSETCNTHGEGMRNAYKTLVGKSDGKRPFG
jgi:hypothetical protein